MSDLAYPTHALDNTYIKTCTIFIGIVVRGRLEPSVLQEKALLLIEQWPELGGIIDSSTTPPTIRPDPSGISFDFKSRRLLGVSLEKSGIPLAPPLGAQHPTFQTVDTKMMENLFHFEAMDSAGLGRVPSVILGLRATILDDATLLGFRLPHSFCDAEGASEVLSAFTAVLNDSVPLPKLARRPKKMSEAIAAVMSASPMQSKLLAEEKGDAKVSTKEDTPAGSSAPVLQHSELDFRMGVRGFANYIVRGLVCGIAESIISRKEPRHKLIRLPATLVEEMKAAARATGKDGSSEITSNDIIAAWLLQNMTRKLAPKPEPIHMYYPFNIRHAFKSDSSDIVLQNCYYDLCLRFPHRLEFQKLALSDIAGHIRKHLAHNRTHEAIQERITFFEGQSIVMPVPQDKPLRAYNPTPIFTSWTRFRFWNLSFSGAIETNVKDNGSDASVSSSVLSAKDGLGKVLGVFPTLERPLGDRPRRFAFIMRDDNGDYWIDIKLSREEWAGFDGAEF